VRYCLSNSFLFITLLSSFFSLGQIENGLVAKFSFNGSNTNNEVGKNHAKVYGASLVEDRFGNENSAYFLHGNRSSYINLGTGKELKPVVGSISIWFKIDHAMESGRGFEANPILFTRAHGEERHREAYYIGYDYKTKNLNVNTTLSKLEQISIYSLYTTSLRRWHHVVMTYDNDFLSFYLDGVLETKMPKSFKSCFLEGDSVIVGNYISNENVRFFNGCVDDIVFFNRVLTEPEVEKLYNAPNPQISRNIIKWACIIILALILAIVLTTIIVKSIVRRRMEKEQAMNIINTRMNELETKAIRTQMNPHFIFNSLNTLQRFVLERDAENGYEYLTKFSSLLRKMLESSTAETISLSEEIEIIHNYLELEKMRFTNSFEYSITSTVKDPDSVKIPFMLIQPFVENSIWHGLLPKNEERVLKINLSELDEKRILCIVDDNGVGRAYSNEHKNPLKKKSLALDFISQRLELLKKSSGIDCYFNIIDKKDSSANSLGTTVEIIIPKLN
jgi:hypothetical protein